MAFADAKQSESALLAARIAKGSKMKNILASWVKSGSTQRLLRSVLT